MGADGRARRAEEQAAHQVDVREQLTGHGRTHRGDVVRLAGHPRLRLQRRLAVVGGSRARRHGRLRHSVVRMGTGELADHLERVGHRSVRHAGGFVPARVERHDRRNRVEDGSPGTAVVGHADDRRHRRGAGTDHQRVQFRARLRSEDRQAAVAARRQLEDHGADADLCRRTAHRGEWPRPGASGVRGQARRARRS